MKGVNKILWVILVCFGIASCVQEETLHGKQLVGSWQKQLIEYRLSGGDWKEDENTCYKDDVEEFHANGLWRFDGGTYQCTPGMGIISGSWSMSEDGRRILFTYQEYAGEYEHTLESLTEGMMVRSYFAGDQDNTEFRTSYIKLR